MNVVPFGSKMHEILKQATSYLTFRFALSEISVILFLLVEFAHVFCHNGCEYFSAYSHRSVSAYIPFSYVLFVSKLLPKRSCLKHGLFSAVVRHRWRFCYERVVSLGKPLSVFWTYLKTLPYAVYCNAMLGPKIYFTK